MSVEADFSLSLSANVEIKCFNQIRSFTLTLHTPAVFQSECEDRTFKIVEIPHRMSVEAVCGFILLEEWKG